MNKQLHILDISNIADVFPVQSTNNKTNKAIVKLKKENKSNQNISNLDRWLAVKFEYGDQNITNTPIADFLNEFLQIRNCSDIKIENTALGRYKIYCSFNNEKIMIPFNTGTLSSSFLCCRLYGDHPEDLFIYIPYRLASSLINNGTIILNSEFDWEKGNDLISNYRKLLIV